MKTVEEYVKAAEEYASAAVAQGHRALNVERQLVAATLAQTYATLALVAAQSKDDSE